MARSEVLDRMLTLEKEVSLKKQWMKEMVDQGKSELANFYEESVVFVTGGSGFLGKQLIEKLIRSCKVAKVYMLLRSKKGKSIEERLHDILQQPLFDGLHEEQPKFKEIVVPIEGDAEELGLGINEKNTRNIIDEVNFIFHVASSTYFELPLKRATLINVRGTREILHLAKECKRLTSMVYVSTAYTHTTKSRVNSDVLEQFYDCPVPVDTMIQLAETQDQEILDNFMVPFKKEWPNTYTFTKAIAEEAVRSMSEHVPTCVIRPAVVLGSEMEPSPGWVDRNAVFSITGLFLGVGLGLLHIFYGNKQSHIEFVCVDHVNNATLAAAKETVRQRAAGCKEPKIYTISSYRHPSRANIIADVFNVEYRNMISSLAIWYCFYISIKTKTMFVLLTWILHYIPAMIIDIVLYAMGKDLRLMRIYKKSYTLTLSLEHFIQNEWWLVDDNTFKLYKELSEVDKDIFNFNNELLDWRERMTRWFYGIRKYIVKDDPVTTDAARRKQSFLRVITYLLGLLYVYILYKFLYFIIWIVITILSFISE